MGRRSPKPLDRLRRWAVAAALLSALCATSPAYAGTTVSLFSTFAGNINYLTTGGTLRTANNATNACSVGTTGTGALSGIPTGSTIVAAYLYWAGSGPTPDYSVTLNGTTVTAASNRQYTDVFNNGGTDNLSFFSGVADVTSIVATAGNSTYTFGGLTVQTANITNAGQYCSDSVVTAGWALVVVYSKSTENNRVINFFEGFQAFHNSSITLTPSNFQVPTSNIDGKFTDITWEGDPDLNAGEDLRFNNNSLADACNSSGNQYNSTINTLTCTGTAATDDVYYGVDIDTFNVSSFLAAGQTSASTLYQAGGDLVYLSAQVISVANTPVSDLAIADTDGVTNLVAGNNTTYTLTVANNGPTVTTGTTTVTDVLPSGESFVSAVGTGWTCANAGGTVTCTNTTAVNSGASYPAISLTVFVSATAASPIVNTASVAGGNFDNVSTNNSASDSDTLGFPNLSTSTKTWTDLNGGDANPSDVIQYTITLKETAGFAGGGIEVQDNIPANLSGFTVINFPGGASNVSTAAGGTNNTGFLDIKNISVPANGTVSIVFQVTLGAFSPGATVNNSASIIGGTGSPRTVTASTLTVSQSQVAASGNKVLYVYDNLSMTRVAQTANSTSGVTIAQGATTSWTLGAVQKPLTLTAGSTVTVSLIVSGNGGLLPTYNFTAQLLKNGSTVIGTSGTSPTVGTTNSVITVSLTVGTGGVGSLNAGDTLVLKVNNTSTAVVIGGTNLVVSQKVAGVGNSTVTFATSTVINVDSVTAFSAVYPSSATVPVFQQGQTVFICTVISDPFGSADVTSATVTITDPNGTVQVTAAAMTAKGAGNCTGTGTASASTEAYEFAYTSPSNAATGFWTATVKGNEGSEGTVSHTANGAFDVDVPALLVMKTVSVVSDPIEGATRPKAIPGAVMQYSIIVQNNGRGPADAGTLALTDPIPGNTAFNLTAKPPFIFTDGGTASGLSVTSGSDTNITYSNNGGTSFTYTPSCTRPCTDAAITNIKITFAGAMSGKTGSGTPSFTVTFQVTIQ